jgi:hypothetical protein
MALRHKLVLRMQGKPLAAERVKPLAAGQREGEGKPPEDKLLRQGVVWLLFLI